MNESPKITIITPALNSGSFINDALRSLEEQDYPDLEAIVVDGGSTDNTLSIARSYPFASVRVSPGTGLYAALNEGIQASTGKVIGFLNSDDVLGPGILKTVGEIYANNEDVDIVCGGAILFEEDKSGTRHIVDDYSRYAGRTFDTQTLMFGAPMINAHFFKADVFKKTGLFDTSYSLASDREFMTRCYSEGLRPVYIPYLAYLYRRHPGSLTLNRGKTNSYTMGMEHIRISNELLNSENEDLQRLSIKGRDDAAVTVLAACLRDLQPARFMKFYLQHSLDDPLFTLRLPGAVAGKIQRRLQARRHRSSS